MATISLSSLVITPEMLRLISEIDVLSEGWKSMHSLSPERLEALRRVATIESIGSSTRIEGSKLSDIEVESLFSLIGQQSFASRDEQEVVEYAEVMETVFQSHDDTNISENYIQQLHGMLLRHSTKDERHRGSYKTLSNNVEAFDSDGGSLGVIFETATPFDTPRKMSDLVKWTREALDDDAWHPLIVVGVFKVVFLAIHPFQYKNGRLSRVLATLLLLKAEYRYVPYASLESVIEKSNDTYYQALRKTQKTLETDTVDWLPWLSFFLRSLRSQKEYLRIKMDSAQSWGDLPAECAAIMELLEKRNRLTIGEAEKQTGAPRATLKIRLNLLIEKGLIERYGKGRGTWYSLPF